MWQLAMPGWPTAAGLRDGRLDPAPVFFSAERMQVRVKPGLFNTRLRWGGGSFERQGSLRGAGRAAGLALKTIRETKAQAILVVNRLMQDKRGGTSCSRQRTSATLGSDQTVARKGCRPL